MVEKKVISVLLRPMNIQTMKVQIIGLSPLLMDKFPETVKAEILAKQSGLGKGQKKLRNVEEEIKASIHYLPNKEVGFPAAGFKAGLISAVSLASDSIRTFNSKHVMGLQIANQIAGLIPIKYKKQDTLSHSIGSTTKVSPQFHDWSCELVVMFDGNNISPPDIINLFNYSGFHVGIGAWRPKGKEHGSGGYGMYKAIQL